ncbi:MAG: J domain-containing protein [Bryobacteraceae bacterium]
MPATEKRRATRTTPSTAHGLKLLYRESTGATVNLAAKLIDIGAVGVGIEVGRPLPAGVSVTVSGDFGDRGSSGPVGACVCWCIAGEHGTYRAGLKFDKPSASKTPPAEAPAEDYYDILQLSNKADPDTIHRVYRLLAQRYHPDNAETGNAGMFHLLSDAYRVISDPEQRAAYDLRNRQTRDARWKIFDQPQATRGMEAEKRKRQGILTLLYTKRMQDPVQPAVTMHEMEDLLGCPREHLEFSLWFLKENGWALRGDNGRYTITAKGAEKAEQTEAGWMPEDRLLPAPGSGG